MNHLRKNMSNKIAQLIDLFTMKFCFAKIFQKHMCLKDPMFSNIIVQRLNLPLKFNRFLLKHSYVFKMVRRNFE